MENKKVVWHNYIHCHVQWLNSKEFEAVNEQKRCWVHDGPHSPI